jgi:hypothetical protein
MPPNIKPKPKSTLDKFLGMIDIFGIADKAKKQVEQRKQDSITPAQKKAYSNNIAQTREEKERAKAMHEARLKEGPYPSTPASSDKASMIKNITKKAKKIKNIRRIERGLGIRGAASEIDYQKQPSFDSPHSFKAKERFKEQRSSN